ncbi:hypothetical protein KQI41_06520 [Tissierella pigra]|uniref:Uncharacterized protein n=1 Tax=Tissierella pigra TaxID=2607614 RepID=A0A6N7XW92_9FIRM|nr:hypothetical protein [Tissierella pigra]MBU5426065.1 hypothetical protein [Tissierella pigra]MSU00814.1 hypothetical protein [Tissierella pigra]
MDNKLQLYPVNKHCMPLAYYYKYTDKSISYYTDELSPLNGQNLGEILNIKGSFETIGSLENLSMKENIFFNDLGYEDNQLLEKRLQSFTEKYKKSFIRKLSDIKYEDAELINGVTNNLISLNIKFSESIGPIVIAVSGFYQSIYTSIIASVLKAKLEKNGNKVVMLSDNPSNQSIALPLFGTNFQQFTGVSTGEIYELNMKLKAIEMTLNPDFIIIDIPGGMMRTDEFFMNDFGIHLWSVMQSIKPDFYFNVVPFTLYDNEYREIVNKYLSKSFNIDVDYFIVTNEFYKFQQTRMDILPEAEFRNISDDKLLHDIDISDNVIYADSLERNILDSWVSNIVSYKLDCI